MADPVSPLSSRLSASLRLLRIVLIVLLVAVVGWLVDLKTTAAMFKHIEWRWLGLAFIVVQLQIVLSARRWQLTASSLGQLLSLPRAITEYYLATVANLSLPGGVLGDAARVYRNRQHYGAGPVAQAVLLERFAGQVILFVFCLVSCAVWFFVTPQEFSVMGGLLSMLVVIVCAACVTTWLLARYASERIVRYLFSFGPAIRRVWLLDRGWLMQVVLSLLILASYVAVFACCALALDQALPVTALLVVVPLVLLSMAIPLSFGGWGLREASAASLWPLASLSAEAGVATSVLYGLVSLFSCLPGLLFLVWGGDRIASECR